MKKIVYPPVSDKASNCSDGDKVYKSYCGADFSMHSDGTWNIRFGGYSFEAYLGKDKIGFYYGDAIFDVVDGVYKPDGEGLLIIRGAKPRKFRWNRGMASEDDKVAFEKWSNLSKRS